MMDFPELIILDVGHGSCTILCDEDTVTLIDCPPKAVLYQVLDRLGIDEITNVLISHSDVDHVGGLPNLLKNVSIKNVYINPDADKRGTRSGSKLWKGIRIALALAEREGTIIHPALTSTLSKKIYSEQVEIEILSPSPAMALGGAGGDDLEGRKLDTNSMSVVVGLVHENYRVALLPGDMDEIGLDNLLKRQENIEASVLLFPHHGGAPAKSKGDYSDFASKLCSFVKPNLVVISHGRNKYSNPRMDIMKGIRLVAPNAHIMCTQLSKKCSLVVPKLASFDHLTNLPAAGYDDNICCGGTISVQIRGKKTAYRPSVADHRNFVSNVAFVPVPICLKVNLGSSFHNETSNEDLETNSALA